MGGKNSGRPRKSDEEKRKLGTLRVGFSEKTYQEKDERRVIAGPWLQTIPDPEYPLGEAGKAKYIQLATELFEQNKLTKITATQASLAALQHDKIQYLRANGKYPTASDFQRLESALRELKIAEHAKVTASPGGANKFASIGSANTVAKTFRLRRPGADGVGKP